MNRRSFALDTSCMVAAVCRWHEHHNVAVAAIERRLDRGERMAIAAHALVESYAVLTRLPAPHRLSPGDAWTLVKTNFADHVDVVVLDGPGHIAALDRLAALGIGGGRSYDALIAACAGHAKVATLLSFNRRHFDPAPAGVVVVDPSGAD